jgi:proteic killer suppression protein
VEIRSFAHKGLRRLYEDDDKRGLPPAVVGKLRKMFAYLQDIERIAELRNIPAWKAHVLTGNRKGTWGLSVTANWRLTFTLSDSDEICDINLEDYH